MNSDSEHTNLDAQLLADTKSSWLSIIMSKGIFISKGQ